MSRICHGAGGAQRAILFKQPAGPCRYQRAPNLTGPWDTLDTQTASACGLIEFWDLFPPPGRAFYRVVSP